MRTFTEFLLAPVVFAIFAMPAYRRFGRYGLGAFALAWVALLSLYILASVPGPEVPLHDFEKTPVPSLAATACATAATVACLLWRGAGGNMVTSMIGTAAVYLVIAFPVELIAEILAIMV